MALIQREKIDIVKSQDDNQKDCEMEQSTEIEIPKDSIMEDENEEKPRNFVGLCNQGATCYMNSLL